MNITQKLAKYISDQQIATARIAKDTLIAEKKLLIDTNEVLSAAEFLELCRYLNIKPEDMDKYE